MARQAITKGHSIIMFSCCEHCFHTREEGRPLSFPNHGEMCPNASCSTSLSSPAMKLMSALDNEAEIYLTAHTHIEKLRRQVIRGTVTDSEAFGRICDIHSVTCAG